MAQKKGKSNNHKLTVMVYLAGDTNDVLSAEMIFALKEMKEADPTCKKIGPDPDTPISVVALFDPPAKGPDLECYVINLVKSKKFGDDRVKALKRGRDVRQTIFNFVKECTKKYPADKYMLVLAGHGSGPAGNCLFPDKNPPQALSLSALNSLVEQIKNHLGHRLDILALSCCLANMIEICHALGEYDAKRNLFEPHVNYLIGSEGFEPLTGWPFKEIFESLISSVSSKETEKIARAIVKNYNDYYADYTKAGVSTDLAAIDLNKYLPLIELTAKLGDHLKKVVRSGAIQLAQLKSQAYLNFKYVDLWDFCQWLPQYDSGAKGLCADIQQAIASAVDKRVGSVGSLFKGSHGIGIYLPWTKTAPLYSRLKFAADTKWHKFLQSYYESRFREEKFDPSSPTIAGVLGHGETKPSPTLVVLPG
jgi:hypothetical protein